MFKIFFQKIKKIVVRKAAKNRRKNIKNRKKRL